MPVTVTPDPTAPFALDDGTLVYHQVVGWFEGQFLLKLQIHTDSRRSAYVPSYESVQKKDFICVHLVRQAKPGFSNDMKRNHHDN
jgi:hypothetical protein